MEIRAGLGPLGAEDFYKKPILCAAYVTGIADPAMYGHESYQAIEFRNSQLKHQRKALFLGESTRYKAAMDDIQRSRERWDVTLRHDAGKAPSNEVGDLSNAQDALAYERAQFREDCTARAIRTT